MRVEQDRGRLQALGDALRAIEAAVGDDHAADLLRVQVPRGELDHVAGADQERRVALEAAEDAARELDAGGCDRDRARADGGLAADLLGDGERRLEQPVQQRARGARLLRRAVGVLQLAEDLGLAEDQRIESGSDREDVPDRIRLLDAVQAIGQRAAASGRLPRASRPAARCRRCPQRRSRSGCRSRRSAPPAAPAARATTRAPRAGARHRTRSVHAPRSARSGDSVRERRAT